MRISNSRLFHYTLIGLFHLMTLSIHAQSITNLRIIGNSGHLCRNTNYAVLFDASGATGLTFTVQLSDSSGSFASPIASNSGLTDSLNILVPSGALLSNSYAIRVIISSPTFISSPTWSNITITQPTSNFSYSPASPACAGTTINFSNSSIGAAAYNWTFGLTTNGAPAASSSQNPSVSFNPALGGSTINYTVGLISTDGYGCTNSSSQILSVKQLPDPRIDTALNIYWDGIQNQFVNCGPTRSSPNFLFTLANGSSTSPSNTNYNINWGDGFSNNYSSAFTNASHLYINVGYFQITSTISNSVSGCSSQKVYTLFNGNSPLGNIGDPGNLLNLCNGVIIGFPVDTSLTNQNPNGTTYDFFVNDGKPHQYFTQANLPAKIYHKFDSSSCGKSIIVNGITYQNAFQVSFNKTNPCATTPGGSYIVRVISKLVANFDLPLTACKSTIIPINNTSTGNFFQGATPNCSNLLNYLWTISPGVLGVDYTINAGTLTSKNISVSFLKTGVYSLKLVISQPINPTSGCSSDSITKTICVQPIPVPNFNLSGSPASACLNNRVNVNNTSNTLLSCAAPTYTWTVWDSLNSPATLINPGSRFIFDSATNANSVSPVFLFTQKGKYKIRLTITNSCPGNFFKDTLIFIKDVPVVSLQGDITYCDSQTLVFGPSNLSHNPSYDSSFGSISSYLWNITQAGYVFLNGDSTSRNPTIAFSNNSLVPKTYRIILRATNECGISLPDTQYVTINPKPIVFTTNGALSFCSGGIANISLTNNLAGGVTYYWRAIASSPNLSGFKSEYVGSNGPIIDTLFNAGNTTQTITYRIVAKQLSTACKGDSIDVVVTVYPVPRVQAANQTICSGAEVTIGLNATVVSTLYTWTANSVKGISSGFANQVTPISGPIIDTLTNGSGTLLDSVKYTIRAYANGCISNDTSIYVLVHPIPVLSPGAQAICSGTNFIYNPVPSITGATFSFTASLISGSVTGFSNGAATNISHMLTNTGTTVGIVRYVIRPIGPSPLNCPGAPINIDVTVNPIPILTVAGASTICSGTPTNIILSSNVLNTNYQYDTSLISGTLTFGYYSKSTDTIGPIAQVITNNSIGNSVVRYTIKPKFGSCFGTSQIHNVTVIPGPTPGTLASPATVCSGTNAGVLTLSSFSGSIIRWERSVNPFSSFDTITNTTSNLSYTNLTQTTRFRVVLNTGSGGACGEVKTAYVQITVDSPTIAGLLTGMDTVCINSNNGFITLNGKRGQIIGWENSIAAPGSWNAIPASSGLNPLSYLNLSQSNWYRVRVKNGVCPELISDSLKIKVDSMPMPAITRDTSYCLISMGNPITGKIVANNIGSSIGTWRYLSGPSIASISSPTSSTSDVSNLLNGIYFFEWKVSNGQCPPNLDTLKLSIFNPLLASISSSQTLCSGQTPTLLSGLAPTGGSGIYAYQWQQSADGISFTDIAAANAISYQPPLLTVNTWYRRITLSGNCNSFSNIVSITVQPSILNNTISPNAAICIGSNSPTIVGTSVIGGNGVYHYQWQKYSAGLWVNLTAVDTLANYSPGALGSTTIFRRLVTSGFCSGPQTSISNLDTIKVYPLPVVNAGVNYSKCSNQPKYKLVGSPTGGIWSGTYVNNDSLNPSTTPIGVYSLIYSYSDSNGCGNSDTVLLSIIAPPVVAAGSDFSICENAAPIQLTGFNPSTGGTWSGQGVSTSGLFNPSVTGSGTFSLIYSFMAGSGCNGSDTLIVTVYPKPNPNFVLPSQKCAKDTFQINVTKNPSATINSYLWQVTNSGAYSNAILSSNTIQNPIGTFPENQSFLDVNYTLKVITITDQGCVDSITKPIILRRRPFALFSTGSNIDCGPASYSIINGTNNVLSNYLWSTNPSNAVIINTSTSTNPNITLPLNTSTTALSYQVKLIATRNDGMIGCTDTAIQSLVVYPKPDAEITLNSTGGCSPLTVSFTNNSDPKNGESISSMSFRWVFDIFPIDTNRDQTKTFYNTGVIDSVRNIRLISTSKWGCKDTADTNVTIYPFPKSSFTSTIYSSCAPFLIGSANLSLQQFSSANDTYTWEILNKSLGIISTITGTNIPTYTIINPDDTVYYRLISSNVHGCKPDTLIRMFRTIPNPVPSYSMSDSAGCSPLVVNFTNTSTAGVSSNWTFSNGAISGVTNPFPITFTNSSHTVNALFTAKLVITAGTGCKDSITDTIRVYPKPLASFNVTSPICANTSLTPSNNSVKKAGLVDYGWKFISPNTSSSISDTAAFEPLLTLPDNQLSIDTSYNIRLRVTSVDACVHDTSKQILVQRRPKALFTLPQPQCGPASITANNGTNNVGSNWLWSVIPTTGVSFNNSSVQNPVLTFAVNNTNDSINYRVKLTATRAGSTCFDTASNIVSIYPKPQAQFTSLTLDSCGPRMVNFTNTSNAKNGETLGSMSFNWTFLGNNIVTSHASGNFVNALVNDSSYAVRLLVSSKHGCKDTTTQTVIVRPDAKAVFNRILGTSCAPFIINSSNITAQNYSNANSLYEWFKDGVFIGNGIVFPGVTILSPSDSALIKLRTTSKNGCKQDSMEMWFYTIENPKPNFIAIDSVACSGISIQFQNTSSPINGLTYKWEFGQSLDSSNLKNPSRAFLNYGTLDTTLIVKLITTAGGTGCKDSISKFILIKPLPNPDFALSDSFVCYPKSLNVLNTSAQIPPINLSSYKWDVTPLGATILNDTTNSQTSIYFVDNQSGIDQYYQVKLTNLSNFGCKDSIQKRVRIPSRPISNFNFNLDSNCGPAQIFTNNTSLFGVSYFWSSLKPGATVTNSIGTNTTLFFPAHFGLLDSIYPIKLVVSTGDNCKDSLVKIFKVFPNPISKFVSNIDTGCSPLPIVFFNQSVIKKPSTYYWNYGDGNSLVTSLDTINKTFVGSVFQDTTFITRLVSVSVNGCKDTVYKPINVLASAVANITLDDTLICSNANIPTRLKINNLSYGSVDTFYWDFGDGASLMTTRDTAIFHPYPNEGKYMISLKAINSCRISYDSAFVTVQVPPIVNFSKTDSVGCSPLDVSFTNLSTKTYLASFNWTFGNGNVSSLFNPPMQTYLQSILSDTFYYIKLNVSNVCGNFPKFDTVRILPKPTAIFSTNTTLGCSPLVIYFNNLSQGIPQNFKWDFGNGDTSNRFQPEYKFNPITYYTLDTPTIYKVRLVVSNICGVDSMTKYITVLPNTVKSFFSTSTQSGCQSLTVKFRDMSTGGSNISWNFGDGGTSSDSSPVHTFNQPGKYTVYQYVNNNCSFDTSSVIIYVYPSPNFSISKMAGNICLNQPVQFNSFLSDSGSIVWYFGDGDSSQSYHPQHAYLLPGKKVFYAIVTSNFNACKSIRVDSLEVESAPIISISADTTRACLYHQFSFNITSNGNHYYTWDFADSNYSIGANASYTFKKPGSYLVKVIGKSILGCIDSTYKLIDVWPIPLAQFDYSPKDTCNGPAWVQFTNLSLGANSYLWDFGNGNTSTTTNATQFYSGIGKYSIQLIAGNTYFCYDTTAHDFEIFSKPEPDFTVDSRNNCKGGIVKFTNTSKFGNRYYWDFGDGQTSTEEHPSHQYDSVGVFNVKLVAFAGVVCSDSISKSNLVTIHPPPDASFLASLNDNVKPYRNFIFTANAANQMRYDWDFEYNEIRTGKIVEFGYSEKDTLKCRMVYLKVTSPFGCTDTSSQMVCLSPYWNGLFVPNAFTPEYGEGDVRVFKPIGIELKSYHVKVFNKWGELVWESTTLLDGKPAIGWDGTNMNDGANCMQGSYIWTIEATFTNGENWEGMLFPGSDLPAKKGNVTLIR